MTSAEPTSTSTSPPELAKHDEVCHAVGIAVARLRAGRSAKNLILLGERGVGKTALLNGIRVDMEHDGVQVVWMEAAKVARSLARWYQNFTPYCCACRGLCVPKVSRDAACRRSLHSPRG